MARDDGEQQAMTAERLGMTASAVKTHWHRLYMRLRANAARDEDAQRLRLDIQLDVQHASAWPERGSERPDQAER